MKNNVILAVIAVIVVSFILVLYFTRSTTKKLSGLEIAKLSVNFFDKMKRDDGTYDYSMNCTDDSGCVKTQENYVQSGAWPVLAYAGLYGATSEQQYLQKMNSEASDLLNSCNGNDDECMWILTQVIRAYKISGNVEYLNFVKKLGDRLLTDNNNTDAMMTGMEAREFALLYEMTNDQKYLNEARVRLERSKAAWNVAVDEFNQPVYSSGSFTLYRFACLTELGEMEIARVSNDNQALANVINFFNQANIESNYINLQQLTAIQPCVETLLILHDQTGDVKYYDQAKSAMQYIITYRWDSPLQIATKYNGDGAYLFDPYMGENLKTTTDTGYMIYLLSRMPKEQFEVLSWR